MTMALQVKAKILNIIHVSTEKDYSFAFAKIKLENKNPMKRYICPNFLLRYTGMKY